VVFRQRRRQTAFGSGAKNQIKPEQL
jgi:hypothetical protein